MNRNKRAVTLIEVVLVAFFVGIFAMIAVPRFNMAVVSRKKADVFARKLVTDFRLTRMLAINNAASNSNGFGLRMTGSSPYASYRIINLSNSSIISTNMIDASVICSGSNNFDFGPLGNLKTGSATQINISSAGRSYTINIIPSTGAVICSGN